MLARTLGLRWMLWAWASAALALAGAASAALPLGGEFQINSYTEQRPVCSGHRAARPTAPSS